MSDLLKTTSILSNAVIKRNGLLPSPSGNHIEDAFNVLESLAITLNDPFVDDFRFFKSKIIPGDQTIENLAIKMHRLLREDIKTDDIVDLARQLRHEASEDETG